MSIVVASAALARERRRPAGLSGIGALAWAACFWTFGAVAASAGPVIINYPFTANPGDVISLEGSGFGDRAKGLSEALAAGRGDRAADQDRQ